MSDFPWSKFFWSDWDSDEALQQCSLAAQGLWMRMLCICAKGDPTGYLAIAGNPLDVSGVAKAAGIDLTEAETLMAELDRWGVFSRDRKGRIYSRRMVRDAKRSAEGRKHVTKRWKQIAENKEEKPQPNRGPNRGPTTQKPEARDQTEKREPSGSPKKGRASRLPADWSLPSEWADIAVGLGLPQDRVKSEAAKMLDWSLSSPNGAKLDWLAAWRGWVRRLVDANPELAKRGRPAESTDHSLVFLPPEHPDFKAVERYRGKPIHVGNKGVATISKAEIEQARSAAGDLLQGVR